ncbi:hypothetical protein HKD37_17G048270 [Glycine soja]
MRKARVMGEVEEVQEQMKADMEAMKEQMATMMEAMMSMKKIMEANAVAVATTSAVAMVNPTPPSDLNQMNHPTLDMYGRTHYVQIQNKHAFPPYGLSPNYTPPNVAYTPNESQQPQSDHAHVFQPMGETHEIPHHNLADFEPCLGYATEGQAVGGIPLQNTLEGPQFRPQPQPFYGKIVGYTSSSFTNLFFAGERIKVGLERGKSDHPALMNVKTRANEEDENEAETLAMTTIPTGSNLP